MQALGQSYTAYAGSRLGTAGQYLCLELLAVLTPPWAVLIQKLFHRLHDPPSWERCPIHELPSRWVRQPHTMDRAERILNHLQKVPSKDNFTRRALSELVAAEESRIQALSVRLRVPSPI